MENEWTKYNMTEEAWNDLSLEEREDVRAASELSVDEEPKELSPEEIEKLEKEGAEEEDATGGEDL